MISHPSALLPRQHSLHPPPLLASRGIEVARGLCHAAKALILLLLSKKSAQNLALD